MHYYFMEVSVKTSYQGSSCSLAQRENQLTLTSHFFKKGFEIVIRYWRQILFIVNETSLNNYVNDGLCKLETLIT